MIPSLLQIPSAVSDSKLHSVLPNNGKGDFTFDRSTGATRINKDGLIEEVGYFSSELVQNGNFSELGSEKATNGNFDNGSTNWTLIGDVSIGNGVCTFFDTGSNTNSQLISQTGILANKTYKLVFDVTRYVAGSIQLIFGGGSAVSVNITGGVGTYTVYVVNGSSTTWLIKRNGGYPNFDFDIDNISVKQVDPNDRWTLSSGFSFGNNQVEYTSGSVHNIQQSNVVEANKTYEVNIITSQPITVYLGSNTVGTTIGSGSRKLVLTAASNTNGILYIGTGAAYSGNISFVSVKEVLGNRPRLSYDITNGVVEDKPHLLLEPSATNLVTFSEDFSQSVWNKANISVSDNTIVSPDGTQNASTITTSNTSHSLFFNFTSVASTQYTLSFYAKRGTMTDLKYRVYDLSNDGDIVAPTSYYAQTNSDRWERITLTFTTPSGCTSARVYPVSNSGVTGTMFLFGCMVEQQAFSTSYIKTAGTTITRAAETCNNSKPSVNSTEGVLYAEIAALAVESSVRQLAISDGTANEAVKILYLNSTQIRIELKTASGTDFVKDITVTTNEFQKIALQYKASNYKLFVNGVEQSVSQTSAVASGLDRINFDRGDGGNDWYGKVKGLAVYNEALSESQLMQLTGVTASSIYSNFVTRTASFTVEALNEVKKVIDNL